MRRRHFLSSGALAAGASLLGGNLLRGGIPEEVIGAATQDTQSDQIADQSAFDYWTKYSRQVEPYNPGDGRPAGVGGRRGGEHPAILENKEKLGSGFGRARGNANAGAANMNVAMGDMSTSAAANFGASPCAGAASQIQDPRKPTFIIYTQDRGFRDVLEIEDDELLDKGDVDASITVNLIRPSTCDMTTLGNGIGGSLRLDFGQKDDTPLPPLQNALAWAAIGVLAATPTGVKLPKLEPLKFSSGVDMPPFEVPQKVPLKGGSGQWRWAFYVQKKESTWLRVLKFLGSPSHVAGAATPAVLAGLGLPAVAWAALNSIDSMYAYLHAKEVTSDWLFRGLRTPVVATQEARSNGEGGVPLRKGSNQYLVVPREQAGDLNRQQSGLEVSQNGFLVPKGTIAKDGLLAAPEASTTTATNITYISLTVDVKRRAEKSC
jgi:hypothetical protein